MPGMRPTLREIVVAFLRPAAFLPFFVLLYLLGALTGLLERTVTCFPMTVITTNKAVAEKLADRPGNCSASLEVEKFMIESPIFNDTDLPPVRDIYLVFIEAEYASWEEVQQQGDAIAEMNPFLKRIADLYLVGRLKMMAIAFILGVITAVLSFPFALPRRSPFRRLDIGAGIAGWGTFAALAVGVAFAVHPVFLPAYLLTTAAGILFAFVFRILLKKHEPSGGPL